MVAQLRKRKYDRYLKDVSLRISQLVSIFGTFDKVIKPSPTSSKYPLRPSQK